MSRVWNSSGPNRSGYVLGAQRIAGRKAFLDALVNQGFLPVFGVLKLRRQLVRFARLVFDASGVWAFRFRGWTLMALMIDA